MLDLVAVMLIVFFGTLFIIACRRAVRADKEWTKHHGE